MTFYFDFETRSRVGIHEGTDRYVRDCEPLILTYTWDDAPVRLVTAPTDMTAVISEAVASGHPMVAHNASFDFGVATHALHLRVPVDRLRCTRAQAYAHGLPGALDALCKVLGIPLSESKDAAAGKSGIKLFSIPDSEGRFRDHTTHPVEWANFCAYAVSDTAALRAVHRKLPSHNYVGEALSWFALDQLINWRGFRLDKPLALAARNLLELAKERHGHEISARTAGAVSAATQRGRLLEYLNRHYGAALGDMRAATLRDLLDTDDLEPGLRWLVEARLEAAKSSGAKYGRGLTLAGPQDRIRFAHQVFGAGRTGRDSHKGYQPGNMVRQSMKAQYVSDIVIPAIFDGSALDAEDLVGGPNTACANALRGAIVAAPGNELVDADFSNIESRLAGWLSAEEEMLRRYREGEDLYKAWYAKKFHVPIEEVTDAQRQIAKVVYLSMQFLGGVGAFVPMAATYNLDLDSLPDLIIPHAPERQYKKAERAWGKALIAGEDFELEPRVYIACDILKQAYREDNANIFKTGYAVGSAVTDAIRTPGTLHEIAKCKIWATGTALLIQLPDDSRLTYFQPRIHEERVKDLETGEESVREHTSYMTAQGKRWHREEAWAGLYWANIIQAIANRLLRLAAERVHADTLTVPAIAAYLERLPEHARTAIVLRIHDALTLDVPKGSYPLSRMIAQMNVLPKWAAGFPIATEGWVNERYGKWPGRHA